jgi:hypothetical protein
MPGSAVDLFCSTLPLSHSLNLYTIYDALHVAEHCAYLWESREQMNTLPRVHAIVD